MSSQHRRAFSYKTAREEKSRAISEKIRVWPLQHMHLQLNRSSQRKQSNLLRLLQERPGCSPSPTLSRWKGTSQGHIDCQLYLFASHMVLFCPCKGKGQRANYLSLCTNILEPNAQATLPSWQSPPPALLSEALWSDPFPSVLSKWLSSDSQLQIPN